MNERPRALRLFFVALLAMVWATGCGDDGEPGYACEPSEAEWNDAEIQAIVSETCQRCHGAEPVFGAPFALVSYRDTQVVHAGQRVSDRILQQLEANLMPPADSTQPSPAERQRLIDWARCSMGADAGL